MAHYFLVILNGGLVCSSFTVWSMARVIIFVKANPYVLQLRAMECAVEHRYLTATHLGMSAWNSTLSGVSLGRRFFGSHLGATFQME